MDIIEQLKRLQDGKLGPYPDREIWSQAIAEIERLKLEVACAKPLYSRRKLEADNKWLVGRLRDAVNVCYGGVTHEEIDTHEQRGDTK